jgi:hypothetical protein
VTPQLVVTQGSGKFVFPNGAVYAGEWIMIIPSASGLDAASAASTAADVPSATSAAAASAAPPAPAAAPSPAAAAAAAAASTSDSLRQRHGFGRYQHGRELYIGYWSHDLMHGRGRLELGSGAAYEGEFASGAFHGRGSYAWPSGALYTGDWADNKMHGQGLFISPGGERWLGRFHNDHFINADGQWLLPSAGSGSN